MSSTTAEDEQRLIVEDALAAVLDAEERCRCVALRITQRMRTTAEADEAAEINKARMAMRRAQGHLLKLHPNRRGATDGSR